MVIAIDNKKILSMFNNRDEQILSETVLHYGDICKAVARDILNNEEDAEECLNDALWAIWNAIPPAQPENYFAYLLKTVRNTAVNKYKARLRNKRGNGQIVVAIEELSEVLPALDNVESQLEHREILDAITVFLRTLPQDQRDIFVRRYWRYSSFHDLSEEFGISENHVKVMLTRLRKRLKKFLEKENLV